MMGIMKERLRETKNRVWMSNINIIWEANEDNTYIGKRQYLEDNWQFLRIEERHESSVSKSQEELKNFKKDKFKKCMEWHSIMKIQSTKKKH